MASHQSLSKSTSAPSPGPVSSLPPQPVQVPKISEASREGEQTDLRAQLEQAERLGHHLKYISPMAGVPPLQARPKSTPAEDHTEEEWEETSVQSKESASASGDPSPSGSSGAEPLPGSSSAGAESPSDPQSSLQAQFERAEQVGHHFSKVSVLSNSAPPLQTHPMNVWVQRACSQCRQGKADLGVQPQLTIGQPGDPYEVEADQVAAQVMSMPESYPQEQQGLQADLMVQMISQLQRSAQAAATGTRPGFESRLSSAEGSGSPLPESVQSFMGSRLGADLSRVRVHTDSTSVQMNQEIGAQAFTHGEHVFYGAGKGPANDHLTAHELTHTIQQGAVLRTQLQNTLVQRQETSAEDPSTSVIQIPEGGEPVNETGVVAWDDSANPLKLRSSDSTQEDNIIGTLPFNTRVQIIKRLPGSWVFVSTAEGHMGYAFDGPTDGQDHIWSAPRHPLPEPSARLHRVEEGSPGYAQSIARQYFGRYADNWGQDERFYVNVLAHVNNIPVPDRSDGWQEVGFQAGHYIWIPSHEFARGLVGVVNSGSRSYETAEDLGLAEGLDSAEQKWDDFNQAIALSEEFLAAAITQHGARAIQDALISLAIMMVAAVAFLSITTAIGAAVGALAGGVGAAPGAAAGFKVGLLLLEWLGIAMIVQDVIDIATLIGGVAGAFGGFLAIVWNADGNQQELRRAAEQFAEAIGMLVAAVLEALVMLAIDQGVVRAVRALGSTRFGRSLDPDNLDSWLNNRTQDPATSPEALPDRSSSGRSTDPADQRANLEFSDSVTQVTIGDNTHTLLPQRWGGQTKLVMCSVCGPMTTRIDELLVSPDLDANVRPQLEQLKTDIQNLETRIGSGELRSQDIIQETNRVAGELNQIAESNPSVRDGLNRASGPNPTALREIRQRHAEEWGVDPETGQFDPSGTMQGLTPQQVDQLARQPAPAGGNELDVVRRRRRYLEEGGERPIGEWAEYGYRANVNRDTSSPHEVSALASVGATANNASGEGKTFDFTEAVDSNHRLVPEGDPSAVRDRSITTRPDGTRPNREGGLDVVEHKHLSGNEPVLDDSSQLRAQRAMAEANNGRHEILISSDQPLGQNGQPQARPSRPLGQSDSTIYFYDQSSGQITHEWNEGRWEPFSGG